MRPIVPQFSAWSSPKDGIASRSPRDIDSENSNAVWGRFVTLVISIESEYTGAKLAYKPSVPKIEIIRNRVVSGMSYIRELNLWAVVWSWRRSAQNVVDKLSIESCSGQGVYV